MPDRPRLTYEVDCTYFGDHLRDTHPPQDLAEDTDVFPNCVDHIGLQAALEDSRTKVTFIAHLALYLDRTLTEMSRELKGDRDGMDHLVVSPEYVRYILEPSNEPDNIAGWTWTFESTYMRYATAEGRILYPVFPFRDGDWKPVEVYGSEG